MEVVVVLLEAPSSNRTKSFVFFWNNFRCCGGKKMDFILYICYNDVQ